MMQKPGTQETAVLLVEDNLGDVRLIGEAIRGVSPAIALYAVYDGVSALDFLRKAGRYANAVRPSLVLLDWKLPGKDGKQVLAEIKSDANLRRTPVVVFSSSRDPADIRASYDLHANCYVVKPFALDEWEAAIKAIAHFWTTIASLPPAENGTH